MNPDRQWNSAVAAGWGGWLVLIKAPDASRGTPRRSGSRPPCRTGLEAGTNDPAIISGLAQWTGVPSLALRAWMGVTLSGSRRRDGGDCAKNIPVAGAPGLYGGHIKAPDASRGTPRRSGSRPPCRTGLEAGTNDPAIISGLAQWTGVPSLALRAWMGVTLSGSRRRDGGDCAKNTPVAGAPGLDGGHAKREPTPGRRRRRAKIPPSLALREPVSIQIPCRTPLPGMSVSTGN